MTEKNKLKISSLAKDVLFDEPMSRHTTFRIGGNADVFVNASSSEEIVSVISYCLEHHIPYMCMGNGSNMLVSDKGIRGVVISIGSNMSEVQVVDNMIYAEAGALMSKIASVALGAELSGFETLSGIPGTVGGGIYMNAGAYGGEIKSVLKNVTFISKNNDIVTMDTDQLELGYRHSIFETNGGIIVKCCLELKKGNKNEISAAMKEYSKRRSEKQPLSMPSAGSTFKRPEGHFAGKLIQDAGLMGFSIGGAQISTKHAGFIVNTGNATADDVLALIEHVKKTVFAQSGIMLEPEVRLIGEKNIQ